MNVNALIDAIVRQTTILIAQLATTGGGRTQLAHTANQVFLDLARALRDQGLASKVVADMFGLALRTYQEKVRRLSESQTMRGQSVWSAVLAYVESAGPTLRADLLRHFNSDDEASVRGVLRDLVHSGLVYRTGRGDSVMYRAATPEELQAGARSGENDLSALVLVTVQRLAPVGVDALVQALSAEPQRVAEALEHLMCRGMLRAITTRDGTLYESHGCLLPYHDSKGWEAALFDHFQAMVTAVTLKLEQGRTEARPDDRVGGSTFGFEVWAGHPHFDEATRFLRRVRDQGSDLRRRIAEYNAEHDAQPDQKVKVITYVGQAVLPQGIAAEKTLTEMENAEND